MYNTSEVESEGKPERVEFKVKVKPYQCTTLARSRTRARASKRVK